MIREAGPKLHRCSKEDRPPEPGKQQHTGSSHQLTIKIKERLPLSTSSDCETYMLSLSCSEHMFAIPIIKVQGGFFRGKWLDWLARKSCYRCILIELNIYLDYIFTSFILLFQTIFIDTIQNVWQGLEWHGR